MATHSEVGAGCAGLGSPSRCSTRAGSSVSSTPGLESRKTTDPCGSLQEASGNVERDGGSEEALTREEIAGALAMIFTNLSGAGCQARQPTRFHGVCPPPVSVHEYLSRMSKYFFCSDEALLVCLVYIDRVVKINPEFVVNFSSIHRLLLTSLVLAAKYHDDTFYSSSHYAKVGGVKPAQLNALEANFLLLVGWKLFVTAEEYQEYRRHVQTVAEGWRSPSPSESAESAGGCLQYPCVDNRAVVNGGA